MSVNDESIARREVDDDTNGISERKEPYQNLSEVDTTSVREDTADHTKSGEVNKPKQLTPEVILTDIDESIGTKLSPPSTPKSFHNSSTTPIGTPSNYEEFPVFSDSDNAEVASIDKTKRRRNIKKTPRRRSNKSDNTMASGYTSIPDTGKIFRNLLILEESLREQCIQQRALRRKYLWFLFVQFSLIFWVSNKLMQSTGTWRVTLQLTLLALVMTLFLYYLSGEYQKTIVLPRKFLSTTNKGLRQLNFRLVKIVIPYNDYFTDLIREIMLLILIMLTNQFHKMSPSSVNNKNSKIEVFLISCLSQCQPRIGVTDVKLVLNTRVFNMDIREGWELYRSEFWINEGVRRRQGMLAFINQTPSTQPQDSLQLIKRTPVKKRRDPRKSNPLKFMDSIRDVTSEETISPNKEN